MTSRPSTQVMGRAFLVSMYTTLESAQQLDPTPDRLELIELLRPLHNQIVHMAGSAEELEAASAQMRKHLERFAATSLGSPEAQQIMQLADPNAVARILARSGQPRGGQIAAKNIYDELLEIPRGRGMRAGDIADRIGPGLRAACGVTATDSPANVRRKVVRRLVELCDQLPADLRISALAALGLHPAADHQFMKDRLSWAARQINRDHPRAAARRMKVAFQILVEQLDDMHDGPRTDSDWYTYSLHALLRMDLDPPQLVEERVIVATTDHLEEIEIRLSAPAADPTTENPITAHLLYGGEITRTEQVTRSHHKFGVRLPLPLRAGEKHEYGVRFSAFSGLRMPPYYVFTPLRPCEQFSVRVRFGTDLPRRIWLVDGIPPRAIDDEPTDGLLTTDRHGEVSLDFALMHQGLSYGLRWSP
jgi:hypothetical protein